MPLKPKGNPAYYAPLPSERGRGRGCAGVVFRLLRGCVQAFAGALVGIERCRFRWEMVSLSLSKGGEMPAESIVNIYQTTGVLLIKPFFLRKIFITLHRHLYVRCIAIEAYSFRKRRAKKRN